MGTLRIAGSGALQTMAAPMEGSNCLAEGSASLDHPVEPEDSGLGKILPVKKCDGCSKEDATADCLACSSLEGVVSFCDPFWELSHRFGLTQSHLKREIEKATVPCKGYLAESEGCPSKGHAEAFCNVCNQRLCKECWLVIHGSGSRAVHERRAAA